MEHPLVADFPPTALRDQMRELQWTKLVDDMLLLTKECLNLSEDQFSALDIPARMSGFLSSFVREASNSTAAVFRSTQMRALKRDCFLLIHRSWNSKGRLPEVISEVPFLQNFCRIYGGVPNIEPMVEKVWEAADIGNKDSSMKSKQALIKALDGAKAGENSSLQHDLQACTSLLKTSFSYGKFLMDGSDLVDSLVQAFRQVKSRSQHLVVALAYFALTSLLKGTSNVSLLLDHIFILSEDNKKDKNSLLCSLAADTPFVRKLQRSPSTSKSGRTKELISSLAIVAENNSPHPIVKSKPAATGRGRPVDEKHNDVELSKIQEIQELFPTLETEKARHLLLSNHGDSEKAVSFLLENPDFLGSEVQISSSTPNETTNEAKRGKQKAEPGFERRNVHDYDEMSRLAVSTGQLHRGRREQESTNLPPVNKDSILSALASFDIDDDERDDTYDVEDVGDTIDGAASSSGDVDFNAEAEKMLFTILKSSPEQFNRDGKTRRSKERDKLRSDTGLTDEAIEGWAVMLQRNANQLRRLEAKYSVPEGTQRELRRSAWRAEGEGADTSDDQSQSKPASGASGGRGRGNHHRNRGGRAPGAGPPADSQAARNNKEKNKSQRANHSRKNQRRKKMEKSGGFGG